MMPMPTAIEMFICEQVIVDQKTKNPSLISLYTLLRVDSFPSSPQKLSVFAGLTDGLGRGTLDLLIRRMDNNEDVYRFAHSTDFPDRKTVVNVHFRFRNLIFPVPGLYEFVLLVDGEMVARRELRIERFTTETDGGEG